MHPPEGDGPQARWHGRMERSLARSVKRLTNERTRPVRVRVRDMGSTTMRYPGTQGAGSPKTEDPAAV